MDRAIYTATGAANAALNRQAVVSNNLANVSTPGFRAQLTAARSVPVQGAGVQTRILTTDSTPWHDNTMGSISYTGRDLDVALPQDGWLAVRTADGGEAYTRAGNIIADGEGQLRVNGRPLIGDGGPLEIPPQASITIAPDGSITALGAGDEPSATALIGRIKLVNAPGKTMRHGDDGLFRPEDGQETLATDPELRLIPGALEGSNVSPVNSMVEMIATARTFDMQMKVISSADDNASNANQLLRVS